MRLIDADELKTLYDDEEFVGEKWHVPIRVILANIDDMPTIDTSKELICSVNVDTDEIIERIEELGWEPVTHETAIDFLLKEGWLQEHDRILTESAVKYGQWILCDEQLPDKKGYYLTSDRFGVTITQWNGRGWVRTSVVTITEYGRSVHHEPPIIAWMSLPKPYGR